MERWLTPPLSLLTSNLTENFRFKIQPGQERMINIPLSIADQ